MSTLLVDGMNVIGSRPDGWWRDRDDAVRRLLQRLCGLASITPEKITVVFDGRPLDDLPEGVHDGVRVLYARRRGRDGADDRLVQELAAEETGPVSVITSDRALAARVRELGARVQGASHLWARLDGIAPGR